MKVTQRNEILYQEMEKLSENGVIGFYNCVEIIELFMIKERHVFNVFTILVACERRVIPNKSEFLTNELIKLKGRKEKFGVIVNYKSISECKEIFRKLLDEKTWIVNDNKDLKISNELECSGKYFAPVNSSDVVPINKILKNNFFNGSYIYEVADKSKSHLSFLYEEKSLIQELTIALKRYIPISLASVSDKLGNYVFQFPVEILSYQLSYNANENLICEIAWHDNAEKRDLIVTARGVEKDNVLEDFSVAKINSGSNSCELNFKVDKVFLAYIIDIETSVIYAAVRESIFMMLNELKVEVKVINENDSVEREFEIENEGFKVFVKEKRNEVKVMNWIDRRIYTNDIEVAKNKKYFVQYSNDYKKSSEDIHREALKDIHWLLDQYGQEEVWLWDPYLCYNDIAETLFFNKYSNSVMKAITGGKSVPEKICKQCKEKICESCLEKICNSCKGSSETKDDTVDKWNIGFTKLSDKFISTINLEFRTTKGTPANSFHDRFIIFPKTYEGAMAWSLGISINQYGKTHHILQKVTDGQMTADAFLTFWNQIQDDSQLIWKSKND
ncbi:VPA1262 family N-terminal domain-containing protein [Acinetobacter higginsii]|uniref:VPA1262 family N-terminal domain-containing protein n=1 Tax=Acinetobacter higginsii TaxID=70347 RepID=UPI0003AAD3F2|nr:VPA1262 family N-terminal domain-containing protein [Acinetobacter higginsii]